MTTPGPEIDPRVAAIGRLSVIRFFLLSFFTAGIYSFVWLLRRLRAFNALTRHERLHRAWVIAALALLVVFDGGVIAAAIAGGGESPPSLFWRSVVDIAEYANAGASVLFIFISLRLRRALMVGLADHGVDLGLVLTLLFGPLYFQYRINRLMGAQRNAPEAPADPSNR